MIAAGVRSIPSPAQKGKLPRLEKPQRLTNGAVMEIDAATRRNLELTRTMEGERRGSLLATIDHTRTGLGLAFCHNGSQLPDRRCRHFAAA